MVFIGLVLLTIKHGKNPGDTGTGGDYTPYPTTVVFRDSDNLFSGFRSEELDVLNGKIAKTVNGVYGKGSFTAYVKDDKVNFLASGMYNIPDYWFEVNFDKIPLRLKVTTHFDGTTTSFKVSELER